MVASQANANGNVYELWTEHNSQRRVDSRFRFAELLRKTHPGYHITRIDQGTCPLFKYAEAGFATAVVDAESSYSGSRDFNPIRRVDGGGGELEDNASFERRNYSWNGKDFIVFFISVGSTTECFSHYYILAPETTRSEGRNHPDTDTLILACSTWAIQLHEEIEVFDNSRWMKHKALYKSIKGSSWDDVILDPAMKANLIRDVQDFFKNRDIYRTMKVPWKRGVILHGPPGNGKTISIKALINSLASLPDPVPSLYVKSLDSRTGPKYSIRAIFEHARALAPCLLVFEDLDSMVEDKARSYFLNEVDGLESNEGILMIGSTNHLSKLDPAITKRPSRFDRKYLFALPGEMERTLYCQYWRKKFESSDAVDFPEELCSYIAKLTDGFSFAYLQELFITSLLSLARGTDDDQASSSQEEQDPVVKDKASGGEEAQSGEAEDGDAKKGDDKEMKAATLVEKPKRTLPEVEIPKALGANLLFRIFRAQTDALLREMDSSEEEKDKVKIEKVSSFSTAMAIPPPLFAMQAQPMHRARGAH